MSRTDAHTPFGVRLSRGELGVHEDHDHRAGDCDLPSRDTVVRVWLPANRCRWASSFAGVAVCSCQMCHAGWWHRRENRNRRHRDRITIAQAGKAWRAGDSTSFDDLIAPNRMASF
jgi:hypothetical protein